MGRRFVACAWLVLQLASMAAMPLAVCAHAASHPSSNPSSHMGMHGHGNGACCPGVAPGAMCPMHKMREGGRACTMTAPCRGADAALLSVFIGAGVMPAAATPLQPVIVATSADLVTAAPLARAVVPDPPPPRA